MKTIVSILLLVAAAVAEPPRYRDERFRGQRQEAAPYPAAGFKPATEFNLPSRQELQPPSTSYGVPADTYAAPVNSYGTPRAEGRTNDNSDDDNKDTREGNADTEAVEAGTDDQSTNKGKLDQASAEPQVMSGVYYVLLPGSQLQRVQFRTESDARNMAYTARLRYSDADRAPLYLYTPQPAAPTTAALQSAAAAAAYIQLF